MSDMIKGFTVVLAKDVSEERADQIAAAITLYADVLKVVPHVVEGDDYMNRERIRWEFRRRVLDSIDEALRESR